MAALIGPLAVYVPTLTPGVDFWDTGEMQTVPYVLGIAHPTGFPLFVLAGFAFGHLFPIGEPAWRLSLFSALGTATAAWLLFVFVSDVSGDALLGTAGAWAFALGGIVWTRAVRAEVHDVALACTALALVAAARAGGSRSPKPLVVAALALGTGIAVHPVVALAVPAAAAFAWPALAACSARVKFVALAAALLPLAAYAYVPLRSAYVEAHALDPVTSLGLPAGGAFYDYGAPSTPAAFARYVSGAAFHPNTAFTSVASPAGLRRAFALCEDVLLREYGVVTLALALAGFVYLRLTDARLAYGAAALVLGFAAFAPNFSAESDVRRYALPALWIVSACAALGAGWLMRALTGRRGWASVLAAGLLAVGLWPSAPIAAREVRRLERFEDARSYAREIERRTVDGSVVVATWPFATPLAYEAYVAHRFGRRRLVSGWPFEFSTRYRGWRARYKHVYVVLGPAYGVAPFGRRLYATERWQLAEMQ